ncbi:MAG: hypothetical protein ACXADB_01960 [Candidatus Hermodarchaeia archaeon]
MTNIELKPSTLMKLKDLDNLVRLVHWWAARERTATILYFKKGEKYIMGTMTSIPGWYNLEGMPLFLYVETDKKPKGVFIKYKADPEEQWDYAKGTFDRTWMYIPLIELSVIPEFLKNL